MVKAHQGGDRAKGGRDSEAEDSVVGGGGLWAQGSLMWASAHGGGQGLGPSGIVAG